ncbi:neuronal acetylcholine receptor subunit alpha-10 isoform X1 [Denticeps clupeoides]|uniref:neuronal acetylcholine receptor subunit alpha-10 isoform X1 n=1 Tax=Denticeps clupeoides TaxID=299321 RepID=UPI0010A38AC2|nr:neuronal acetylcholine receptor subunit alpha-10 isoform X1 [Denticeps clupeoides]
MGSIPSAYLAVMYGDQILSYITSRSAWYRAVVISTIRPRPQDAALFLLLAVRQKLRSETFPSRWGECGIRNRNLLCPGGERGDLNVPLIKCPSGQWCNAGRDSHEARAAPHRAHRGTQFVLHCSYTQIRSPLPCSYTQPSERLTTVPHNAAGPSNVSFLHHHRCAEPFVSLSADDQFSSSLETNVVIRHDGQVTWDQPSITKSSCRVDVSFFPFDSQQCHLTFGSWTHNGNQMDLFNTLDSADLTDFVENVEWEVLGMPAKKSMILYGCCSDPYPDITYTLHLKRRASFYIFNLLIPCMLISFLAPLSFYLPAESGEKVSLGVTVLLALTVFQLLVAESMPPSENVPLIGKYYIATMTMITMSTAVTIFVMNIHHCGPEARPVPTWVRRLVLHYLARICFVYEKGERCMGIQPEKAETPPTAKEVGGGQKDTNHLDPGPETGSEPLLLPSPPPRAAGCHREGTAVWAEPEAGPKGEGGVIGDMGWGQGVSHLLLRQIEFIAKCYHDQRSTQQRTGEWRKVAKVMDSFFMWLFFIMVFLLSLLIIGKAI